MKNLKFPIFIGVALLFASASFGKSITISKAVLMDKIKGGWAGKVIGCTYGGPTEFKYKDRMIPDDVEIKWPDHQIKWYYDHAPGLYDDIYMDLTFVDIFEKKGLDAPINDFANAFANAGYPLWHANQSARYNILIDKLMPPQSGYWKHNPHADDIDFQIEADYAGLMSPGMINTAVSYTDQIGHIMSYGDGWYGGVYVAAMFSLAFVSNDVNYIVKEALKTIPAQSTFYQCIADVIKWYKQNPADWKKTWQLVQDKYGKEIGCPDGVMSDFNIDAKINSAYCVMGLLYGEGDYSKSLEISTRCGQDSDCNPSTVGGILGTMMGYSQIPEYWMMPLKEVEERPFAYTDISLSKAYQMSYNQALKVIAKNSGKVTPKAVSIKTQNPKTVRLEQSFEGLALVGKVGLKNKPLDSLGEVKFTGCGVVLRGKLEADDKAYVGLLDVYIDGKKMKTVHLPASNHSRSNDIYWNYDLEQGDHVLTVKRLNPKDNVKTTAWSIVVYKKAKN